MGPPIVIGGSEREPHRLGGRRGASMGPPIVIGGSVVRAAGVITRRPASRGPRLVIGGSPPPTTSRTTPSSCFNGAADRDRRIVALMVSVALNRISLQWGRRS